MAGRAVRARWRAAGRGSVAARWRPRRPCPESGGRPSGWTASGPRVWETSVGRERQQWTSTDVAGWVEGRTDPRAGLSLRAGGAGGMAGRLRRDGRRGRLLADRAPRLRARWRLGTKLALVAGFGQYRHGLPLAPLAFGDAAAPTAAVYRWDDRDGDGTFLLPERGPLVARYGPGAPVATLDDAPRARRAPGRSCWGSSGARPVAGPFAGDLPPRARPAGDRERGRHRGRLRDAHRARSRRRHPRQQRRPAPAGLRAPAAELRRGPLPADQRVRRRCLARGRRDHADARRRALRPAPGRDRPPLGRPQRVAGVPAFGKRPGLRRRATRPAQRRHLRARPAVLRPRLHDQDRGPLRGTRGPAPGPGGPLPGRPALCAAGDRARAGPGHGGRAGGAQRPPPFRVRDHARRPGREGLHLRPRAAGRGGGGLQPAGQRPRSGGIRGDRRRVPHAHRQRAATRVPFRVRLDVR